MPIWPEVTPTKADLFNRYGRGIIHMGLHIGTKGFVYDRQKSRKKRRVRVFDLLPYLTRADYVMQALEAEEWKVNIYSQKGKPVNVTSMTFTGSADNWQTLPQYNITIETDGPIWTRFLYYHRGPSATHIQKFALIIDGQIDIASIWQHENQSLLYPRCMPVIMSANTGPGEHRIQIAICLVRATSIAIGGENEQFTIITPYVKRRG